MVKVLNQKVFLPFPSKDNMKYWTKLILLFSANAVSGVAQGISMIAIPWYFAQASDTARFGLIYAIITSLSLLWGPVSGTIVDSYNRKRIFQIITTVCGTIVCAVAIYGLYYGGLPWYAVAFVFTLTFLNYNIHYPNLYAFVQEITDKKDYYKVTSYIEIQGQLASVMAGAGAAILLEGVNVQGFRLFGFNVPFTLQIAPWEIHHIFMVDGLTYFLAFAIISMIVYRPDRSVARETGNIIKRLKVGLTWLNEHRGLMIFGLASYGIFITVLISSFYLAAKYVEAQLQSGANVYATGEMMFALGSIFAGLGIQWIFRKVTIQQSVIILTLIAAAIYFVLGFSDNIYVFFILFFMLGIANAGTRIRRVTYLFQTIPNHIYGRAGSVFFVANVMCRMIFLLFFALPFFHVSNNIVYAFFIFGVFLMAAALVMYINMRVSDIKRIQRRQIVNRES